MKRFLCTMLLLTSVVLFVGCGNIGSITTAGDITVIRVWTDDGGTKEAMVDLANQYNKTTGKEKGIKIEYSVYGSDYKTMLDLAIQNDQVPELIKVSGNKETYVKRGDIIPIDDMPDGTEFIQQYGSELIDGITNFNGKTYFLPTTVTRTGIAYNKDLFKAAGILDAKGEALPPQTWDDVRDYAKRITNPTKTIYGIAIPLKFTGYYTWMLNMPFSASFPEENFAKVNFDNLTYNFGNLKQPLNWLMSIKADGSFFPGAESLDNDTARAQFAEGNVGMIISQSWDVGVLTTQFVASCDWGIASVPVLNKGERYPVTDSVGGIFCISKSAKKTETEKVMEVFKLFHSTETQTMLYEKGLSIPYRRSITERADVSKLLPQWKAFADLDGTMEKTVYPSLKLEGDNIAAVMLKVWAGTISVDGAITDLNTRYNNALKSGAASGDIDIQRYKTINSK